MGLENHVDQVIEKVDDTVKDMYSWSNGLNTTPESAELIMTVLNRSNEFGPTRYNHKTGKIEFGVHESFFNQIQSFCTYQNYCEAFKIFEVDRNGLIEWIRQKKS